MGTGRVIETWGFRRTSCRVGEIHKQTAEISKVHITTPSQFGDTFYACLIGCCYNGVWCNVCCIILQCIWKSTILLHLHVAKPVSWHALAVDTGVDHLQQWASRTRKNTQKVIPHKQRKHLDPCSQELNQLVVHRCISTWHCCNRPWLREREGEEVLYRKISVPHWKRHKWKSRYVDSASRIHITMSVTQTASSLDCRC